MTLSLDDAQLAGLFPVGLIAWLYRILGRRWQGCPLTVLFLLIPRPTLPDENNDLYLVVRHCERLTHSAADSPRRE